MKIAVCLKQVPRLEQVRFHPKTNRIVREDVEAIVNPLDLRALGHALALREAVGGEIVALTMGPPAAREGLEEAVQRGADRAVHLADKRFAGADTLATARALARALAREDFDLVLFGRSTLDGATAQVGPQVAEMAGLPHVGQAIELHPDGGRLRIETETERGSECWVVELPAAVGVERGPEPPDPDAGREIRVDELSAEDLGGTPRDYGTRGSPTFVKEVRDLPSERETEEVDDVDAAAERIARLVANMEDERSQPVHPERGNGAEREIWALAERDGDEDLHPVSLEAISCARSVASDLDAEVVAVLMCDEPRGLECDLAARGADRVLVILHPRLADYDAAAFVDALSAAIERHSPFAVIAPWTARGRDYVPRTAARMGLGLTGDFVSLEVPDPDDDDPDLLWLKPAWAGTVQAPIIAHTKPAMGTLRPGVFTAAEAADAGDITIDEFAPELDDQEGPRCDARTRDIDSTPLLDDAAVVVCIGGDTDRETAGAARRLAAQLGGSLGATTEAIAAGHAPHQLEVSTVKRSLGPSLFIALGVSDAAPLDAVRAAGKIVTVHADADAPAHAHSDLAVVADPQELLEALLGRLDDDRRQQ